MMAAGATLPVIVREHVDRWPDREVVTFRDLGNPATPDTRLTYGDLWSAAAALAERLEGCGSDARVLVVLTLRPRLMAAHLAAMLVGAVPIIHSHPSAKMARGPYARHLAHVLASLRPEAIITTREFLGAVEEAGISGQCRIVLEEDVPPTTTFVPRGFGDRDEDSLCVIQHSSGSTGLQKGVPLSHRMIQEQCASYARAIALSSDSDRICSWIPLYHDMGLFTTWLLPLLRAVPVAAIDPFEWVQSPSSFLRLITDFKGTLCWQPNFAYNLLASRTADEELASIDLSSMRGFSNCSEPVRAATHRAFAQRFAPYGLRPSALWVCYAMAENAFAVTAAGDDQTAAPVRSCDPIALSQGVAIPADSPPSVEIVSVGRPVDGCHVRIVGDARESLPDGRVGEVAISSDFMLREYYGNKEATSASIVGDWFFSGDLGFMLDGQLHITGRKKDILIVGGRNFYPQDIEAICDGCTHAVPGRSVAMGTEDEQTGTERIIVLVESRSVDPKVLSVLALDVRRRVFEELDCALGEVHVVPHMWLLKTTSGKIARRPNLDRFRTELAPPASPLKETPETSRGLALAQTLAWSLLLATALYISMALLPGLSWGIYAGF
jgi:fatty-acyl-CoA synthase